MDPSIPDTAIRLLNPILMIALGLGIGAFAIRRYHQDWGLFGVGALTFILSQVAHIPFNVWVLNPALRQVQALSSSPFVRTGVSAIGLGVSAGVFEETARYLVYRYWLKDNHARGFAVVFGAGHGGAEAMIIGGLTLYTTFRLIALRDVDLGSVFPENQLLVAQAQIEAFWSVPWYAVLLGAVERLAAICFHIAMAIIVIQVFLRRQIGWLGIAIGAHAFLDALAVWGSQSWSPLATEGVIFAFSMLSLWLAFRLRPPQVGLPEPIPIVSPPPVNTSVEADLTTEKLEESRYD